MKPGMVDMHARIVLHVLNLPSFVCFNTVAIFTYYQDLDHENSIVERKWYPCHREKRLF